MKGTQKIPKLFLHGLDHRFIKTMMLFLQGPCQGAAMVVTSPADADIDLFDYDSTTSRKLLLSLLETRLQRPVIVLSLHQYDEPRVLYLKKPIQTQGFLRILSETAHFAVEHGVSVVESVESVPAEQAGITLDSTEIDLFNDDLFQFMETAAWGNSPVPTIPIPIKALHEAVNADLEPDHTAKQVCHEIDGNPQVSAGTADAEPQDAGHTAENLTPGNEAIPANPRPDPKREDKAEEEEKQALKIFGRNEEKNKTAKHATASRLDEKTYHQTVGITDEVDFNDPAQLVNAVYSAKEYFQGCFQAAWALSKMKSHPLVLQSPWCLISIFPRTEEVWLEAGDSELSTLAGVKIRHKNFAAQISIKPIDPKSVDSNIALDKFQNSEAFLWKLACWSSKGRYPQELEFDQPVYLKHWPNFTRLLITPHALRIAALLIKGPRTMCNVAEALDINPQYVFIFVSAAYATGVAGQAKRLTDTLIQPPEIQATKKQGLFGKIMSKLRK